MPESLIDSSNSEEGGMAKWHRFYLSGDYLLEDWKSNRLCADWLYCSNNNSKTLNDYLKNTHFFLLCHVLATVGSMFLQLCFMCLLTPGPRLKKESLFKMCRFYNIKEKSARERVMELVLSMCLF